MCKNKRRCCTAVVLVIMGVIFSLCFIFAPKEPGRPTYQYIVSFGIIFLWPFWLFLLAAVVLQKRCSRLLLPMDLGWLLIGNLVALYLLLNTDNVDVMHFVDFPYKITEGLEWGSRSEMYWPALTCVLTIVSFALVLQRYLKYKKNEDDD